MASSSSSHIQSEGSSVLDPHGRRRKVEESVRLYDVFINHRGPDVKETLASQLYKSLEKLGIRAFLDKEEKDPGVSFPSAIKTAIESARIHIAIFSKGYAESPWCLDELLRMLNTEAKIIPLFFEVKPWELRHIEKGSYHQAFKNYEEKSRYKEKLELWKEALNRMADVAGYEISNLNAADECKKILSAVQKEIQRIIVLHVAKHPVGLSKLVEELESRCLAGLRQDFERQYGINEDDQGKARIVGIYGMGGTGKTTLSKQLFNKYRSKYTRASFLFDVREASRKDALPSLQLKLLKDLFEEDHPGFTSKDEGIGCLQYRLGRIRSASFLIVLDDIDHWKQLDDLLVTDILLKPGNSLIIITTRDSMVLRRAEIPNPFNLEGLDEDDARKLFCLHAFGESNPATGYEILVKDFVKVCGRIPLSLQVLGIHVKNADQESWNSALRKLSNTLPQEIKDRLKISFDSLDSEQKQIFMDIACFFIGSSKNMAMKIWEGSGWVAHDALETLKAKCLVQEIENNSFDGFEWEWEGIGLGMHNHLQDLGREMANQNDCRRLWQPQALKSLESKGGFRNIINGIEGRCFHSLFDRSMCSQITYFLGESDDCSETLPSLLWLQLDLDSSEHPSIPSWTPSWIPLQMLQCLGIINGSLKTLWNSHRQLDLNSPVHPSIPPFCCIPSWMPSWIPLNRLQCLRISNGHLRRLWKNHHQAPLQLKELQLYQTFLEEVPDLGLLNNLENVALDDEYMAIKGWSLLESLRINASTLYWNSYRLEGNLATTNSEGWTPSRPLIIQNFQESTEVALPKSPMSGLEYLEIVNQESVTKTLVSGDHCTSLKTLKLHSMENLIEIDLVRIVTLNSLEVSHCENLKILTSSKCPELRKLLLTHLSCLETLRVGNCERLRSMSGFCDIRKLEMFNISQCHELQELNLVELSCLERIGIADCKSLKRLSGVSHLAKLVELYISQCPELEIKLCLRSLYCLERIKVDGCRKLKRLELIDCKNVKTVSGIDYLEELAVINIRDCNELLQLWAHNLCCWERITIDGCEKLDCHAFDSLLNLKIVTFDIGRAVVGAESILDKGLFSEADIGADVVTEMDIPCSAIPEGLVSKIVTCGLVVVERSTPLQYINCSSEECQLPRGRWIVTMVLADPKRNTSFITTAVEAMCCGIVSRGFRVTLMKGQESKIRHVLQTIDNELYQKY